MYKKILTIITCSLLVFWLNAQSFSPEVMSSDGATNSTENVTLDWTLGELAIDYLDSEGLVVSEGFHQPLLEVMEIPNDLFSDELTSDQKGTIKGYHIEVWPNPVKNTLNVKIESDFKDEVSIEVVDVMGRKSISNSSYLPNGSYEFDFSNKVSGLYLLRFLEKDGTLIKTILNVKH